jgi:hypothetical protein
LARPVHRSPPQAAGRAGGARRIDGA